MFHLQLTSILIAWIFEMLTVELLNVRSCYFRNLKNMFPNFRNASKFELCAKDWAQGILRKACMKK